MRDDFYSIIVTSKRGSDVKQHHFCHLLHELGISVTNQNHGGSLVISLPMVLLMQKLLLRDVILTNMIPMITMEAMFRQINQNNVRIGLRGRWYRNGLMQSLQREIGENE